MVFSQQKPPFLIDQQDELSIWRYESFYDKEPETIKWINYFATSEMPLNLSLNNYLDRAQVVRNPLSNEIKGGSAVVSDLRPGGSGYKLIEGHKGHQESINVQVLDIDSILYPFDQKYVLKIDTDGSDFEILQGGIKALQSGCIVSVLIEASQDVQNQIIHYLKTFNLIYDYRFNDLSNHSDRRRILSNKTERNRIYTQKPLIF